MAQILTPGFLKWDGFKFVLDDSIEGEPGPPGLDGLSALVYRPGGVQTGNVYSSWADLMEKRITIDSPITIVIDDSIEAAFVDVGVWNLGRNTTIAGYKGPVDHGDLPVLTIPDGAQLQNPSDFENVEIFGSNNTFASIVADGEDNFVMNVNARNSVFATDSASSFCLFEVGEDNDDDTTMQHTFNLYGASRIEKRGGSNVPVIQNNITTTVNLHLYDNSTLDGYTIRFNGENSEYILHIHDWGITYSTDQPQTTCQRSIVFPDGSIIDLSNSQAADGTIVLGRDNQVEGSTFSLIYGQDHTVGANNQWVVLLGGESSNIGSDNTTGAIISSRYSQLGSGSGGDGVFVGSSNGASGGTSVVLGGVSNFSTGLRSGVLAGGNGQASGETAVVLGGYQGNASGLESVVLGGEQNTASADQAVAMGNNANAIRNGQLSHGVGSFGTRARFGRVLAFGTAINGGNTTFDTNLALENGFAYMIRATVVANRASVSQRATFVNNLFVSCSSGTATVHNSTSVYTQQPNGTSWTIGYTASGANVVATFTATGAGGGSTVHAVVTYEWTELGNGV